MLLWIILFLAVMVVSFILAYRSVLDFRESPLDFKSNYSLFLIRNPSAFSSSLLTNLHRQAVSEGLILSLENLFKGQRRALTIYGPIVLLKPLEDELDLLELEDYTQRIDFTQTKAWEIGAKKIRQDKEKDNLFPPVKIDLQDTEQFWWQMVLRPIKKADQGEPLFQAAIRVLIASSSQDRLKSLPEELLKIGSNEGLLPLPQAYSPAQIIEFYQKRNLQVNLPKFGKERSVFYLSTNQVLNLLNLPIS